MNRLFPLPLYTFLRIAFKNGGFSRKGLLHSAPWFLKTILLEPLRWIELTKNKKIRQHTLHRSPIFVLGYYRSGTTYLQELFMQDDRFGYLSGFQSAFPEIMLTSEKWLTPVLASLTKFFKVQYPIHRIPLSWDAPGEDDVTLTTFMDPFAAHWGYFFPKKAREYFDNYVLFENITGKEVEKWKANYMLLLKKNSLAFNGKQIVHKNPPDTARIKLLLSLFPGAKFVHIYRNPYDVFASKKRVWKVIEKNYMLGSSKNINYNDIIIKTYSGMMHRYFEDKNLVPTGQLAELCYEDFIKDPVNSLKQLYSSLQLGDFNHCEKKMTEFVNSRKEYVTLDHQLPENEIKYVSKKLGPIIRQLGYPIL